VGKILKEFEPVGVPLREHNKSFAGRESHLGGEGDEFKRLEVGRGECLQGRETSGSIWTACIITLANRAQAALHLERQVL
jgi:hypothetical protein